MSIKHLTSLTALYHQKPCLSNLLIYKYHSDAKPEEGVRRRKKGEVSSCVHSCVDYTFYVPTIFDWK